MKVQTCLVYRVNCRAEETKKNKEKINRTDETEKVMKKIQIN